MARQYGRPQIWEAGFIAPQGGGKGGAAASAPTQTTSTVNQSNLPEYARPYFEDMLKQSASLAKADYQPYTGDRIAELNTNQNAAIGSIAANQGSFQPYFNQAGQGLTSAMNTAQNTQFNPTQATNSYNASGFTPDKFTGAAVGEYMNPYLQQSLNPQIELLNRQFAQQGNQLNSKAAANGAFGGYRNALEQSSNRLNNNLAFSNLVGQGYNNAYNSAMGQFNASQQQNFQANQALNQNQQQQAQLGLAASGQNNQYGLSQAQIALQGGQQAQAAAQGLGALGTAQQQAQQSDANALLNAGTIQQNQSQTALNQTYQDFINQQYYPYQTLNWQSGILRGVPVTANQTVTGYQAPPSPVSQLAGLGLGAAGLSKIWG